MRTVLAGMAMMVVALPAGAQQAAPFTSISPTTGRVFSGFSGTEYGRFQSGTATTDLPSTLETPTMRRQKLARAIALRDEALALQARDGGRLTDRHARQIREKSRAILTYSLMPPGSLSPIRD